MTLYIGKCFPCLVENVVVFKADGKADNTHFWYCLLPRGILYTFLCIHTKCENSTIYLCMGSTTTFDWIKKLPHTFSFINLLRGRGELNNLNYGTLQSLFQSRLFAQRTHNESRLPIRKRSKGDSNQAVYCSCHKS